MTFAIGSTSLLFEGTCTLDLNVSNLVGTGRSLAKTGRLDPATSQRTSRRHMPDSRSLVSDDAMYGTRDRSGIPCNLFDRARCNSVDGDSQ